MMPKRSILTYLKIDMCACDVSDAGLSASSSSYQRRHHSEPWRHCVTSSTGGCFPMTSSLWVVTCTGTLRSTRVSSVASSLKVDTTVNSYLRQLVPTSIRTYVTRLHWRWIRTSTRTHVHSYLRHTSSLKVDTSVNSYLRQVVPVTKPLARLLEPLRIATILNIYLSNGM